MAYRLLQLLRYRNLDASLTSFPLADRGDILLSNADSIIVRHLFWFGMDGYEGTEVRTWEKFSAAADNILEIGANIGFYTVCGGKAAPKARYTAAEPHPVSAAFLRKNLLLNDLDHVRVVEGAVVGHKETETMTLLVPSVDQDAAPTGSFLESGGELTREASGSFTVPVVEMQSLLPGVDLLKLDAEGHEYEILKPVRGYLEQHRPTLFVEVHPASSRLASMLQELCRDAGYRPFVCTEAAVRRIETTELQAGILRGRYGTRDVFLVGPN
jgi:FkbM family methyltransferase